MAAAASPLARRAFCSRLETDWSLPGLIRGMGSRGSSACGPHPWLSASDDASAAVHHHPPRRFYRYPLLRHGVPPALHQQTATSMHNNARKRKHDRPLVGTNHDAHPLLRSS